MTTSVEAISSGLHLDSDGIWYSARHDEVSYPSDGNAAYLEVEERSFWFRHRNNCILSAVQAFPPRASGLIADVGGGNGIVALALVRAGCNVMLVEPGPTGAANAKARGLATVVCATVEGAGFKPNSFAAIGMFDVIEHIKDDHAMLCSMKELLEENGKLYITVPAYSVLWSEEDIRAGHFRRYTITTVCRLVERIGFRVLYATYFFRWLPFPIAALRAMPYRLGLTRGGSVAAHRIARTHAARGGPMRQLCSFLSSSEALSIRLQRPMKFGSSCLIVAAKSH